MFAPGGSTATYYERLGANRIRLGTGVMRGANLARLDHATTWRCDRLVRRFEVDAVGTDGTRYSGAYSVRTPSCRNRFTLNVPRRVARGRTVTVGVRDTWRLGGVKPSVCVASPGSPARCRAVALRAGQAATRSRFKPGRSGRWKVRLRYLSARPLRLLAVGGRDVATQPAPAPVVLSTGDSTIQGMDGFLSDRLGESARVVARVRPATGIGKPGAPSWLKTSRIQSSTLKPSATVVSLGVNDGLAMRTWTRFGGHVAWMALPPTGVVEFVPRLTAVNAAVARAAVGLPRVSVVRIDRLMSSSGRYEPNKVIGGHQVRMYLSDALHLSPAGIKLAAGAVVAELRESGGLDRVR